MVQFTHEQLLPTRSHLGAVTQFMEYTKSPKWMIFSWLHIHFLNWISSTIIERNHSNSSDSGSTHLPPPLFCRKSLIFSKWLLWNALNIRVLSDFEIWRKSSLLLFSHTLLRVSSAKCNQMAWKCADIIRWPWSTLAYLHFQPSNTCTKNSKWNEILKRDHLA